MARRRLRHRIPVRVRHNYRLLASCATFLLVITVGLGSTRVRPYVTSAADAATDVVTVDIAGTVDLFDSTVAHEITLTFADADYQRMLDAYFDDGEKEYLEADLVVDGTTIPSVGIRLKGNSTLGGLTRDGETAQRGGAQFDGGAQFGDGGAQFGGGDGPPDGAPQGGDRPGGGMGMGRAGLAAEEPETLPWLISFDEFVEGRRYQGLQEIAVRVGGMGGGSAVANEALSLSLLAAAGMTTQRYAYSAFTVNDRPATARLVVEHPDAHYAGSLGGSGVLYKSLASGSFTDQGADVIDYQDDFKQINLTGSQDLQPVINLIRWTAEASDEEFDAELADHLDVEAFARYVAAQNLLLNFDDMAGPGRNYYLWYDLTTRKFTVISWDHNLTLRGDATLGPHDTVSMGGGRFGGGQAQEGGEQQQEGGFAPPEGFELPEGFAPPEGFEPPDGFQRGDGGERGAAQQGGGPGRSMGHPLKERFLASDAFTEVYEAAYRDLYQRMFASGAATAALDGLAAVLATVDGADADAVTAELDQLRTVVTQRTESLRDQV
ncbi:CotH kinase family protein [Solwaraspora sp. WMMD791]|uniref:CotH kinase family protein n=1 Tax=Solwaraspora sp. WMMD791 TaxID=3016086 RepID=UPI00249BA92F|nr:CotH kinase family protein [Solwaraspora sp. WMMD791]WFE26579.1 CotH kinase family protein [Solwaraspora sp. WMMD791]